MDTTRPRKRGFFCRKSHGCAWQGRGKPVPRLGAPGAASPSRPHGGRLAATNGRRAGPGRRGRRQPMGAGARAVIYTPRAGSGVGWEFRLRAANGVRAAAAAWGWRALIGREPGSFAGRCKQRHVGAERRRAQVSAGRRRRARARAPRSLPSPPSLPSAAAELPRGPSPQRGLRRRGGVRGRLRPRCSPRGSPAFSPARGGGPSPA